jgi:epoxyqueuosine reductase QueG
MSQLADFFRDREIRIFGLADLSGLPDPVVLGGRTWPNAVSFALPINAELIEEVQNGPTDDYAQEYRDMNKRINETGLELVRFFNQEGYAACALPASDRTDPAGLKGDFPHKTAATLAGIGWVGRNALLITAEFGPWVRLGTVFTDMPEPIGVPQCENHCGTCSTCVEACPAQALKGGEWHPGIARSDLLDAPACERYKKEHFHQYNQGNNCGICAAVCPLCAPAL